MRKQMLIVAAIGLLFLLPAGSLAQGTTPGEVLSNQFITSTTRDAMDQVVLDFYPSPQFVQARYSVDEYELMMTTEGENGTVYEVRAQMYVPNIPEPLEAPVIVLGAGTTGLVPKCAPTLEDPEVEDWGRFRDYMRTYATQGYILIMPDYVGFQEEQPLQPYYVAEMQGRVALDAARAVYNVFGGEPLAGSGLVTPFDAVFVSGYSQGGTTVFAARDIQPEYAPDVPLVGILAFGSVTDQKSHMLTRPEFAGYRWVAWEDYYGADTVDLDVIFNDLFLPTVRNEATTLCLRQAFEFYPADPTLVYREPFYNALVNDTMAQDFPQHNELLELNSPGFTVSDVEVIILQGEGDETIPPAKMAEFLERYCGLEGNTVTYNEYISTTHFDTREKSYLDTLSWMAAVVRGEETRDDCPNYR